MPDAVTIVEEITESSRILEGLPPDLAQLLERHCLHLVELVASLQIAGRDEAAIRGLVTALVSNYEIDLLEVLSSRS